MLFRPKGLNLGIWAKNSKDENPWKIPNFPNLKILSCFGLFFNFLGSFWLVLAGFGSFWLVLGFSKYVKVFTGNFSVFLARFNWHQHQKVHLRTSAHLNFKRESHAKKTFESNLSNNYLTIPEEQLHNLRLKSSNRSFCAHLNINSLRNKFSLLANNVKDKIDILMISETKLDLSFAKEQFHFHGFSEPYRLDRILVEYLCLSMRTYPPNIQNHQ